MKHKKLLWIIAVIMLLPTLIFLIYLNSEATAELERVSAEPSSGIDYLGVFLLEAIGYLTLTVTVFLAAATTRESFNFVNPQKNKKFAGILLGTSVSAYVLYWFTFIAVIIASSENSVFLETLSMFSMILSFVLIMVYIIAKFIGWIVSLIRNRAKNESVGIELKG